MMRVAINPIAVACCVFFAATNSSQAMQEGPAEPACSGKPNLTNISISAGSVFMIEGAQPQSVSDDVLMIDFDISIDNASDVEAPESRVSYSARVLSLEGKLAEKIDGTVTLYWTPPGGTEHALASIMASKLSSLVQPSGEISGKIAFHAIVDVDNEVIECNEADNEADYTYELTLSQSAP